MPDSPFDSIEALRASLGASLCIVGHHYQTEEVIRHTDIRGDSLELARRVAEVTAEHIVFCGVYFMGESAALLARPGQKVHLPAPAAECSMALMSSAPELERVMNRLCHSGRKVIPLAYVNSTLAVKAVVGRYGGAVCTSANARRMLEWAFAQGDAVLFLPDMNLGRNSARAMGLTELDQYIVDLDAFAPAGRPEADDAAPSAADRARLLLWPGYCSIHTDFTPAMVSDMRTRHPGAKIIVHPECTPEVTRAADGAGSTSFLIDYAAKAPDGATLIIGTEVNLVRRLAGMHKHRLRILPLAESACEYMAEITELRLLALLEGIARGDSGLCVRVAEELKAPARASLERMLRACA
ncbi:quinolinate synthase NadA [Desulfovibrio sp. OttesenSCG-928-A18]|nr:quinolinate synthase NadA [Desulfovibrio sp. OttesenSCG-928-A18]